MSLWNTAQALGLRCRVVPIMPGSRVHEEADSFRFEISDEDERPYYFFQSRFQGFARGRLVAEHDEKDTWGHPLPEDKVTWLNSNGDVSAGADFREVQTAHPTVSLRIIAYHKYVSLTLTLTLLQHGNEPGIGIDYTRAAMLIGIPPYLERGSGTAQSEFFWEGMESDGTDDDEYVYERSTSGCSSDDEVDYEYDEGSAEDDGDEDDEGKEEQMGQESNVVV